MFNALTIASHNRWEVDELLDPSNGDVLRALEALQFTRPDAERVVNACGTRPRLLSPLLKGWRNACRPRRLAANGGCACKGGSCMMPSTQSALRNLGTLPR